MSHESSVAVRPEWLGLTHLADALSESPVVSSPLHGAAPGNVELIDRLQRTLEILTLVDTHADGLVERARRSAEHDSVLLAVDLRRLADRLQVIGDFIAGAGDGVLALERRILQELDERYRAHSGRQHAA
ncbi:MAG: hypothetical protein U1F09_10360 [Steroidobacteraceae bacterium]